MGRRVVHLLAAPFDSTKFLLESPASSSKYFRCLSVDKAVPVKLGVVPPRCDAIATIFIRVGATAISILRRHVLFPDCLFYISLCPCDFRSRSLSDIFFGLISGDITLPHHKNLSVALRVRFRERNNIVDRICRVRTVDPEVEQTWSSEDFQVLDWSNRCVVRVRSVWLANSVNFCQHFASQIHEPRSSPSRVITSIEEKVSTERAKELKGLTFAFRWRLQSFSYEKF
jgi:hypothetical protein